MRKIDFLLLLFISICNYSYSQTLSGVVYDRDTQQPIPDVSVYLDGTSLYALTNEQGEFSLSAKGIINTNLIVRQIGYDMMIISQPFDVNLNRILLTKDEKKLKEIEIEVSEVLSREEKLKMFRKEFLGNTKAGKLCRILNEDDLILRYSPEDKILRASSTNPILVENDFLGYEISYSLIDFWIKYGKGISFSLEPLIFYMRGYSVFIDKGLNNRSVEGRRKDAYRKTSAFFFKSLVNGDLKRDGYEILNGKTTSVDVYRGMNIEDTLSMKKVSIIPLSYISYIPPELSSFAPIAFMHVYNTEGGWSNLMFLTDSFVVDQYGIPNAIDKLIFSGAMASRRLGDMLPLDYEPE